ncbi:sulfite exporter TauE/SafE family protein [Cellulomonas hominis]
MSFVTIAIAAVIVFVFTTILSMAGLGAAFILVPAFYWLGVPLKEAMAIALLLNGISMIFASIANARHRLIVYKVAIPIAVVATILSPVGAYSTQSVPKNALLWAFATFLVFAGSMMLFYRPKQQVREASTARDLASGGLIGAFAGYLGGLLGVGGGNFIIPVLVGRGMDPKKASGTTAFVVVFASLAGFLGHAAIGGIDTTLLVVASAASIAGAILGANLMSSRLKSSQVKLVIGGVLYVVAVKIVWGLV